jgi:hypothetical protein
MLLQKRFFILSVILAFSLLLSACNLGKVATTPEPPASQATIDAQVAILMQTVSVNLTNTAAAIPTGTFTLTPTPEPTATATLEPTATLELPTATNTLVPTRRPSSTPTTPPAAYSCKLISVSPSSGTKVNVNTNFDTVWKITNTGTKDWELGYVDLKYSSGTKMQTAVDVFDVKTALKRGAELSLTVNMRAPATAGKYTASWIVSMESTTMCVLPVKIEAVTP